MKKSKFLKPYQNKKTTFRNTDKKSGVYLIKENDKLVYIGFSSVNLYRTLYRHFQTWNHPQQEVVSYSNRENYTVRVVLTTPKQAPKLEEALILKHKPRDNRRKIESLSKPQINDILDTYKDCPEFKPREAEF